MPPPFLLLKEVCDVHVKLIAYPDHVSHTSRNRYGTNPFLSACVFIRCIATPYRWKDIEFLFGNHVSHLSEIYWETLEIILDLSSDLIFGEIKKECRCYIS